MKADRYNVLITVLRCALMLASGFVALLIWGVHLTGRAKILLMIIAGVSLLPCVLGVLQYTLLRRAAPETEPQRVRFPRSQDVMMWIFLIGMGCFLRWIR